MTSNCNTRPRYFEPHLVDENDPSNISSCLTTSRFSTEIIQESNRFVHGNVVFELNRYLQLTPNDTPSSFRTELPPFEALIPFDGENKWTLTASALVLDGTNPEQMQKGIDELVAVKRDFEGCFEFQALDRHIFDTRIKF